jgi:putative spermidine/putrescine transport system permease protein
VGLEGRELARAVASPSELATEATATPVVVASPAGQRKLGHRTRWLIVAPFLAYVSAFLLIPTGEVILQAFRDQAGSFSLSGMHELTQPQTISAFEQTIKLSLITAVAGGLIGLFVAQATLRRGTPGWLRPVLTTFSGVASNFAGVPLAFAFIATLGSTGIVTDLLQKRFGVDLYGHGFTIYGLIGLSLTYIYFQFPLMILIILPALEGIRREWREAATSVGATPRQFWRYVGLPVLLPSLLGAIVLLFGNGFSAYATPYALSSGYINLVPVLIGEFLNGDLASEPQLGSALAFGMIVVIGITVVIYALLQRRTGRWVR